MSSLFLNIHLHLLVVSFHHFGTVCSSRLYGGAFKIEYGTDRLSRNLVNNKQRCVTSQKNDDFICVATET